MEQSFEVRWTKKDGGIFKQVTPVQEENGTSLLYKESYRICQSITFPVSVAPASF